MKLSIRSIALWVTAAAVAAVVVLFGMTMTVYAQEYDLWVGGTKVTSENLNDIPAADGTKVGKASFDPGTNTLTLESYRYTGSGYTGGSYCSAIYSLIDIDVNLIGNNSVDHRVAIMKSFHTGLYCADSLTIKGNGSLDVKSDCGIYSSYGIYCQDDITIGGRCSVTAAGGGESRDDFMSNGGIFSQSSTVTIKDNCTVTAKGGDTTSVIGFSDGIFGQKGVNITGGTVNATGGKVRESWGIRVNNNNINITCESDTLDVTASGDTCALEGPVLNSIAGTGWTSDESNGEVISVVTEARKLDGYKKAKFETVLYDLWVGGRQVTSGNCKNIPAAEGETKTGKASFDPDTNTLTLDNYKYEGAGRKESIYCGAIISDVDLTIDLIGENKVIQKGEEITSYHEGILSDTLTIQGNGSLETTADCGTSSNYGILCTGSITIGGSCKVTANGASGEVVTSEGISSMSSTITIKDDCTVNAAGGDIPYNSGSAYSKGIRGRRDVNIIGGRVKATGGKANDSRGIESNSGNISIDPEGDYIDVETSGDTSALSGPALNSIPGVGWTSDGSDVEEISVATDARKLETYKKVRFGQYPLWVGGTKVTVKNLDDIPAAEGETKTGKASFDPLTNTLTLDNYQYEGAGYYDDSIAFAIYSRIKLTIDLIGENEVIQKGEGRWDQQGGIYCSEYLTIQSNGSLEATTDCGIDESDGILANGITVDGNCKVTANGPSGDNVRSFGIKNYSFPMIIKGNCTVNATGGNCGSGFTNSIGILTTQGINITRGRVKVASGEAIQSNGIHTALGVITIAPEGDFIDVEVSGNTSALKGSVLNSISGTGWAEIQGKGDGEEIPAVTEARLLDEKYKKVKFFYEPPEPKPEPKPKAKSVVAAPKKMRASGKKALVITWMKIKGAEGYDIFFNKSTKKNCKKIKTIKGNKKFSWKKKGLKTGKAYKSYVRAWVKEGGKKRYISKSPELHAYTGNGTKKYTNVKAVKVAKRAVTLRKGRTFKIKAKLFKVNKKKKFMTKDHAPKLRYLSMNKKVATVTKGGKIKAVKKGTCYVYVYAHNGANKKVKVTVK